MYACNKDIWKVQHQVNGNKRYILQGFRLPREFLIT